MKRVELFDCPMDIATLEETVDVIATRIYDHQFTQHVVVNVAKLVNMRTDAALAASVRGCDIINIDGMGVVWAARLMGIDVPERVAGVDLFASLLEMAARSGLSVYFLGAEDAIVRAVAERARATYPALVIAGFHHGYWDDETAVVAAIRNSNARMLFVALSSPKKETFINRWHSTLGVDFVMGVGGTFDVFVGHVPRAPHWMQRMGLEWFFRLLQEPRRLWRRYLVTNSRFAVLVATEIARRTRSS